MKNLQEMYEKYGDCNIIFESNKHQFNNAKLVHQKEEINEEDNVILSCFDKIR
jgi:hypothetical protein